MAADLRCKCLYEQCEAAESFLTSSDNLLHDGQKMNRVEEKGVAPFPGPEGLKINNPVPNWSILNKVVQVTVVLLYKAI